MLNAAIDLYVPAVQRVPATEEQLRQMAIATPLPAPLRQLYRSDSALFAPRFELFEPMVFVDVNADRESFDHLANMVFFADDQGSGLYFMDPEDTLGLGAEYVYWTDRGLMDVDEVAPLAATLTAFLVRAKDGIDPVKEPTLGQSSLRRLTETLAKVPANVDAAPGVDPLAFSDARENRNLMLTMATGDILMRSNGMIFTDTGRKLYPLDQIISVAGGAVAVVGHDPVLGHLGVTLGGWQDLPPDRLLSFHDLDQPENGQLLGRMADVLTFWIKETVK